MKKICIICKKEFHIPPCRKFTAKYCSNKCKFKGQLPFLRSNKMKEVRKKHSGINHPRFGKHWDKKHKEYLRKLFIGRKISVKTRKKISQSLKKRGRGNFHNRWKGGKFLKNKYFYIWQPHHPFATKQGYIAEHRLIMEKYLNRFLKPDEIIHHINNDTTDNRIENLKLFKNRKEHTFFHNILFEKFQ